MQIGMNEDSATCDVAADLGMDAAVLGSGLPPQAERLIAHAGMIRGRVAEALALLETAHQIAPRHPATLIALYRFHFYGNRLAQAREIAVRALAMASAALQLPADWRAVESDARFSALDPLPRFYLFTLKGFAYLSLRLGEIELGQAVLDKLSALDPLNRVGYRVLHEVIARIGREDADYEEDPPRESSRQIYEVTP